MEGYSLMPIINDCHISEHEYLFWEHEGNRAVRYGDWKIVATGDSDNWELYKLNGDRIESVNLASQYPDLVHDLVVKWNQWAWRTHVLPKP